MARFTSTTIFTSTTRPWKRFSPRAIPIHGENGLPAPHWPHVYVDEVGITIVPHSPALETKRCVPQARSRNSRHANVDGFRLHVEAVAGDTRVRTASAQELVGLRGSISTNHVDFTAWVVHRCGQVVEQVEQAGIETVNHSGDTVTEIVVEFGQCFRQVVVATPVDDLELLVGMGVIKAKAVFSRVVRSRLPKRRGQ